MTDAPRLQMWHDYVCPFSYVAAARIMRMREAEDLNLDVRFHPWPLEAANGAQPSAAEEDQWVRLLRAIEPDLFARWNPSSGCWPATSRLLFAAYQAAVIQDSDAAARFDLLVRQAIFQHPRPLDSLKALSEAAAAAGLDLPAFRSALEDGSADQRAAAAAGARERAIPAIPALVLPDGTTVLNPGIKLHQTDHNPAIDDDLQAFQRLLKRVADEDVTSPAPA